MKPSTLRRFAALTLVAALSACHALPERTCRKRPQTVSEELVDLQAATEMVPILDPRMCDDIAVRAGRPGPPPPGQRQFNTLALSGGGSYGAYSAGVLIGWTESGTRPDFDVVTGVSTGSFVATMAFLGPAFDSELRRFYTTVNNKLIYRERNIIRGVLTGALADYTPLFHLIEQTVTPALIRAVAVEHSKGRRLYVGTTNLDTRRQVIWDMGAIASRGTEADIKQFRSVLLASAAIPGFFPPVVMPVEVNGETREELHVDGGVTAAVFFYPPAVPAGEQHLQAVEPLRGSNLYIILAGKLFADNGCVNRTFSDVATDSIVALLYAQTRGDLYRLFSVCLGLKMNYLLTSIPQDYENLGSATTFDTASMARLFEVGRQSMLSPDPWRFTPPGLRQDEVNVPRSGTRFTTVGDFVKAAVPQMTLAPKSAPTDIVPVKGEK